MSKKEIYMLNRELVAFVEATKIDIEGHGEFKFSSILDLMMIGNDEYYLVYGTTPDDHPTFIIFHVNGKQVLKAVVIEDSLTNDAVDGYLCWDNYLDKKDCVLPMSVSKKSTEK